jgi:hypothetical protein
VTRCALFFAIDALIGIALAGPLRAETGGQPDSYFSSVPFDQWLTQNENAHFHWTAHTSTPQLSSHQRLAARLDVEVDGSELAKRRGKGEFVMLLQVTDENDRAFQTHNAIDLEHVEKAISSSNAVFSQYFFVLPGDYRISIGIFDSATQEHSVLKRKLHVAAPHGDPLPEAWRDLPAIEFIPASAPPDNWYQPQIDGKLRLAVEPKHPVHVDLVVNLTPSERFSSSNRVQSRNLGALIPAAKVISQVDWQNSTFGLAFLDLSRRRIAYRQDTAGGIDWTTARNSLGEINPGIIDVKSLENRKYSAEFFVNEIARRIRGPKEAVARTPRVVIILSSVVNFEPGQEMHPIEADGGADCRLFYVRYQPLPPIYFGRGGGRQRGPERGGLPPPGQSPYLIDELEPLLKPADPKLFDVNTPEQFRKALATILSEIEKM